MIYLCSLYLTSLSASPPAWNITHSVQLQTNPREPKVVREEIPWVAGSSASTAWQLLLATAPSTLLGGI